MIAMVWTRAMGRAAAMRALAAGTLLGACGPSIEQEEPRELVEHRLEPCRKVCEPMLDPECGTWENERLLYSVEECVEDCADIAGGWYWARQEDGTDACAEEWFIAADCIDGLTCEEQHEFFTRIPATDTDWPCKEETDAKAHCFFSTPSVEREDDE